jgi:arylsulfatase A-like enzyme
MLIRLDYGKKKDRGVNAHSAGMPDSEMLIFPIRTWGYFGALQGAAAWATYAIMECWFVTIVPFLFQRQFSSIRYYWLFTFIVFLIYALAGMIIGGILGSVSQVLLKKSHRFSQVDFLPLLSVLATFSITVLFLINLIIRTTFSLPVIGLVVLVVMIMMALALSGWSRSWREKLGFFTRPAMVSAILLGESWILLDLLRDNKSRLVKAGVASLYLAGLVLISFILHKYLKIRDLRRKQVFGSRSFRREIVFLAAVLFMTLVLSAWINRPYAPIHSKINNPPPKATLPNIILIVMDTVRADHLSIYGYERDTTPNLGALAKEATLYRRAISSSDVTLSTHASLFTGMYPRRHGAHMKPPEYPYGRPLSGDFETLAEVLSKEGYSTLAVISNYLYLSAQFGFVQGFQYYDFRQPTRFLKRGPAFYLRAAIFEIFKKLSPRVAFDKQYKNAEEINAHVFRVLDKSMATPRPFFLFINYMDAHIPYIPPPPFDGLYPGKMRSFTTEREYALIKDVMKLKRKITDEEYRHLVSQYDGGIAYLDSQIMKLMERLKSLDLYDKSLIIVTSDHGEAFGEKNLIDHGHSVYQNQIHVPLIIKYPGMVQGKVVNELVSSVDIMPTILTMLGVKVPDGVQGQSLLSSAGDQKRIVLAESYPYALLLQRHSRFHRIQRAILSGSMKLIKSTNGEVELYNLAEDPNEETNLYGKNAESRELEGLLDRWLRETGEAPNPKVDKRTLERLKSLGYVNKDKKSN